MLPSDKKRLRQLEEEDARLKKLEADLRLDKVMLQDVLTKFYGLSGAGRCTVSARLDYSRPGTPTDNPHIESFSGSFRDGCLNMNWFMSLEDARDIIERWRRDYNEFHPHSANMKTTSLIHIDQ